MLDQLDIQFVASIALGMALFIVAGSIHEFAHAASAYLLGDRTARDEGRMTINPLVHIDVFGTLVFPLIAAVSGMPLFGWMKPVPVNPYFFANESKGHAITAFAGPLSNLAQASLGLIVLKAVVAFAGVLPESVFEPLFTGIWMYIRINLLLSFFNLLPFPPLDGGWILRHFLPLSLKIKYDALMRFGFLLLYLLLFVGVLNYVFIPVYVLQQLIISNIRTMHVVAAIMPLFVCVGIALFLFWPNARNFVRRKSFTVKYDRESREREKAPEPDETMRAGIALMEKIERGAPMDEKDHALLGSLSGRATVDGHPCDDVNFSADDAYCLRCENIFSCMIRRIRGRMAAV